MTVEDGYYKVTDTNIQEDPMFRTGTYATLTFQYDGGDMDAVASVEDNWDGDKEAARKWMKTVKYLLVKNNDLEAVAVEI